MNIEDLRRVERVTVFKNDTVAGILSRTDHGALFEYDDQFREEALRNQTTGVSFSLSAERKTHFVSGTNLHSFFAGILPEGLRLKALKKVLKTSEDDLFTMLVALGENSIGDVYASYSEKQQFALEKFKPISIKEVSFFKLFHESIVSPDVSLRDIDSGIPGVMPKVSASMISFPVSLHKRNRQYILKLGTDEHPRLIENESFFMNMAKACDLEVASSKIVKDIDGVSGLLVERFDRVFEKETKSFTRLHVEDACQFLDRYPQDKYRLSLREIADAIVKFASAPVIDILKLLNLYLFSYLIGNGDLHAKNISLFIDTERLVRLAPAYDLLSMLPYGDRKMALRLDAKDDNFSISDFIQFGNRYGVTEKAIRKRIVTTINKAQKWTSGFDEIGFDKKICADLKRTFDARANKLLQGLS